MKDKIVIIGGGAIGLSIAYYLRKQNREVTLIDKGQFGEACSRGNMGWVCPLLTQPVPAPGLTSTSMKWMLKKDSPLYIKPTSIPKMSSWLFRFWRNCNAKSYAKGRKALIDFQKDTLNYYHELVADGIEFEHYKNGFIFLFQDKKALQKQYEDLIVKAVEMGFQAPVLLSHQGVREHVAGLSDKVIGGILLSDQTHIRPETLWDALSNNLAANGVEMRMNIEAKRFVYEDATIQAVETNEGTIEGTKFVFATGAWSAPLLEKLGYKIPVEAGKGYSITMNHPKSNFNYPMYLGDSSAGVTPFEGALRIGGTMELSGINLEMDTKRINGIRNAASQYFASPLKGKEEIEWTGMRPMTPDGLPIIGKATKHDNAYIATGHAMEGVALALKTGSVMSEVIATGKTNYDLTPFCLERFD